MYLSIHPPAFPRVGPGVQLRTRYPGSALILCSEFILGDWRCPSSTLAYLFLTRWELGFVLWCHLILVFLDCILNNCFKEPRTKEVIVLRFLTFPGWLSFRLSERSPGALATSVSQVSCVSLCLLLLPLRLDDVLESFKSQQSSSSSWKAVFVRDLSETSCFSFCFRWTV